MSMQTIRGRHCAQTPLLSTVSGVASTSASMMDWFARHTCIDIITTKSIEREPNPGNREPVITEPRPGCFGNAVGLRNPGVAAAVSELQALRDRWSEDPPRGADVNGQGAGEHRAVAPLLNVSLSASSEADFVLLARALSPVADLLELNFSCPHAAAGYGASIGSSAKAVARITQAVKAAASVPVLTKLTPNVQDIAAIASVAVEAGADGIVAINTVGPVQYLEADSGRQVLTNAPGGKGGMSGEWIYESALEAVASIRRAVGPGIALIGMGGVSSQERAREMHRAGADAVGIGSVLATLHQRDWAAFLASLKRSDGGAKLAGGPTAGGNRVTGRQVPGRHVSGRHVPAGGAAAAEATRSATPQAPVWSTRTQMSYRRATVARVERLGPTIAEITLEEDIDAGPGQTVFLWIPDVGEKPFAVASCKPAVFLVKEKGAFTRALVGLSAGSRLYVRGPYGDAHTVPKLSSGAGEQPRGAGRNTRAADRDTRGASRQTRVVMVVAGTGVAAVSSLATGLIRSGIEVRLLVGLRDSETRPPLGSHAVLRDLTEIVYDRGVLGRVLDVYTDVLAAETPPAAVYAVGPEPFMRQAAELALRSGLAPERVFLSLERTMLCGVGLCGACDCGGKLTCQYGTFVTAGAFND